MIKIISKKRFTNLMERIDDLTLELEYLQGEYNKLLEQVDIFNADNKKKAKEIAKLKIELEDTKGFLEQEKACSKALRKERDKDKKPKKTEATKRLEKLVKDCGGDVMTIKKKTTKPKKEKINE